MLPQPTRAELATELRTAKARIQELESLLASHTRASLIELNDSIHARPDGAGGFHDAGEQAPPQAPEAEDLRAFFNTIDHLLFVSDTQGNLLFTNQAVTRTLGYTAGELLGQRVLQVHPPEHRAEAGRILAATVAGIADSCPLPLLAKDGRQIPVETRASKGVWSSKEVIFGVTKDLSELKASLPVLVSATALYDENGAFVASRTTIVDNTDRKAADEAQRRANQELETALRMKDEFLANISHELRPPLNGILALSEIMMEQIYGPLNERQDRAMRNIEASGKHLLALINDLLDLSKIEAGKLELNLDTVVVDEACKASLLFIKDITNKKKLQISYRNDELGAQIRADPRRLKQILVNLLSNAVKFTPEGGSIQLRVAIRPDQGVIRFAVQDSGPGIAAGDLQRLFQPFTQLNSTLARQFEGTGLGLALVKRLAVQHGGSVDVTSSGIAGAGSCFTVTLPYTPISPAVQDSSAAYMQPRAVVPAPKRGDGPRVLLVEDNEVSIEALGGYLEYLGYRMLIARTGLEAIACAQAQPPDLVLMDIQLPLMDGFEVTRQLRRDPRFATLPIIALTALAMPNDRARCLEAGATEYMSKPIRPRDLATLMERLLST